MARRNITLLVSVWVLLLAVVSGCSGSQQATEYSDQTRDEFILACTDRVGDSRLVTNVCGCVYAELETVYSYGELQEIADSLPVEDDGVSLKPLPEGIETILAECVVSESES